jgi:ribosome-associated toxin RatA of RatAB toxin-antitoxin module
MADVFKTVLIQHSAERMYNLVIDVAKYPEFLPWCGGVEVFEQTDEVLDAKVHIKFKGINQFFHTRNANTRPSAIDMVFVDGPFKKFHGHWKFVSLRDDACKVEFQLHYEFESIFLEKIIGPVFGMIAGTFVDGFVKRADQLYGN